MLRAQRGDEAAFGMLMQKWELPVKAVIARLVFNTTDAEELAQETFVQIWQHRGRFQADRPVKPWILGIAVNLARKRLRWWRRRPSVSLDEWTGDSEEPVENLPVGKVLLEKAERAQAVRDAIAQLPTEFREALVLFEYEQMSYHEIATALDVSEKVVENRIARARARLRPTLAAWI
jgi:RNA polymerase sigma factor (sigma-70 family)